MVCLLCWQVTGRGGEWDFYEFPCSGEHTLIAGRGNEFVDVYVCGKSHEQVKWELKKMA